MKILLTLIFVLLLSGCAVLEFADMVFDDDCMWRGTVAAVEHLELGTSVIFEGENKYSCDPALWVSVGDWIEVRNTVEGCVFDH